MAKKILWTNEQINLLKNNLNLTYKELSKLIGRGRTSVSEKIRELNLIKVKTQRKYNLNEDYFKNIDTEEKAYWLGFIAADGCVMVANKDGALRMSINLNENDKEHIEKFRSSIEGDMPIINIESNHKNAFGKSKQIRINVNSKKFCNNLIKNNITFRKTNSLIFPNISKCLQKHFIRGYFDGDGWISISKRKNCNGYRFEFGIVGNSISILKSIQNILEKNNIKCNIYSRKSDNAKSLKISAKESIKDIINYIYSGSNIYLSRKFNKAHEILKLAV